MSFSDLILQGLAQDAANRAATLIKENRSRARDDVRTKSSQVDVVTAVDTASEALIREVLLSTRPNDSVTGEEEGRSEGGSGVRWIVDPIDGTVNFLYGLPYYAVSIAAEVDGVVRAGVVHNVGSDETFFATLGGGAWRSTPGATPERLHVSAPDSLADSLIGTGFAYLAERRAVQGEIAAALLPAVRDLRRMGSAALDLCSVAAGRLDGHYELGLNEWDHAAGGLIAREAGAVLTGLPGREFADPLAIACTPHLTETLLPLLAELHDNRV